MDKLVEDLLSIERTAKDSMEELEEERTALAQRIADEISRGLLETRNRTDLAIQAFKQEAEISVQTELAKIESQFQQKATQLNELFDKNAAVWRNEWVSRVLKRGRL